MPELYDRLSIGAVLAEWCKTIAELPLIIRRAVELGLFSSAQLVRFMAMDVRPNVARTVARSLPPSVSNCRHAVKLWLLFPCNHHLTMFTVNFVSGFMSCYQKNVQHTALAQKVACGCSCWVV